jgi:hypothetical protein
LCLRDPRLRDSPGPAANRAESVELQLMAPLPPSGSRSALSHSIGSKENGSDEGISTSNHRTAGRKESTRQLKWIHRAPKLPQNGHPWVPTLAIVFEYCWRYDKIWNLSSQARQGKRGRFEHALRDRYKARLTNPKLSVSVGALPSVDLLYCLLHPALFGCARVA